MRKSILLAATAATLAACSGEPGTAEDAENYVRETYEDDDEEITWLIVEDGEEPGQFVATFDVVTPGEDDSDETKICDVSVSGMTRSYTCQSIDPSIIRQSADSLAEDYARRDIDFVEHDFERTGDGFAFGGQAILRLQATGERASIECLGDQDGTQFTVNCDQDTARPLPANG